MNDAEAFAAGGELPVGLLNVHLELGSFGIVVDIATPGSYNPDQLDDMTRRAQRLLGSAVARYATTMERLAAEDDEPLDDEFVHDGAPPAGELTPAVANGLELGHRVERLDE